MVSGGWLSRESGALSCRATGSRCAQGRLGGTTWCLSMGMPLLAEKAGSHPDTKSLGGSWSFAH